MKRFSRIVVAATVLVLLVAGGVFNALSSAAGSSADPQLANGRWLTESGNLEINIAQCGEYLCGTVSKVLSNRSMSDPRRQMQPADGRSPLGMQILSNFKRDGNVWKGRIYNRENGKTYDCLMTLAAPETLKVRGYKFLPALGKTQVWTRVSTLAAGEAR